MSLKTYLGDGAYAELRNGELILTAENGIYATDRVVLGSDEWVTLLRFVQESTAAPAPEAAREEEKR